MDLGRFRLPQLQELGGRDRVPLRGRDQVRIGRTGFEPLDRTPVHQVKVALQHLAIVRDAFEEPQRGQQLVLGDVGKAPRAAEPRLSDPIPMEPGRLATPTLAGAASRAPVYREQPGVDTGGVWGYKKISGSMPYSLGSRGATTWAVSALSPSVSHRFHSWDEVISFPLASTRRRTFGW